MTLTNPRKRPTIRISINYRVPLWDCYVPGKQEPAFVRSDDMQDPPHKWHGFRIFAHITPDTCGAPLRVLRSNPEVSGKCPEGVSNPLSATVFQTSTPRIYALRWHKNRGNGRFWCKYAFSLQFCCRYPISEFQRIEINT
jgi:hypothetical protein